ncbi:hypothetical protein MTR_3g107700 [Medicago truncatula]|uniref:Uncharacterized protein n=1 Tax=Medicago truncatula TaxID=3880 RepID=G7JBM1_MEDTR|nr:hypothetical protein MTR_3g107700 [Medicago truncatula]
MMKRVSLHGSSRFYEYPRKKRAVAIMEKVDAVAYPHNNNTGEKYMHYSVTNCTDQLYESRKEKFSDVTTHVPETIEEPGYSYSNPSSVGSCSVIGGSANNFCNNTLADPCFEDDDSLHSDAEYVEDFDEIQSHMLAGPYQSEEDTLCIVAESLDVEDLSKEAVAERIHRASVGGLHALLSMAKYDARFASFSLCKLIGVLRAHTCHAMARTKHELA